MTRNSRVKRDTGDPVFPSWLEETVQKSGKRSREQILLFMQNLGIKFERVSNGTNGSPGNPAERSRDEQNAKMIAEQAASAKSVTANKTEITTEEPNPTMKQATLVTVNETEINVGRKISTSDFHNVVKSESKTDMNATRMVESTEPDTGKPVQNLTVATDTSMDGVSTNNNQENSRNGSGSVFQNEVNESGRTNSMSGINTVNDKMEPTFVTGNSAINENKSGAETNTETGKDPEIRVPDESPSRDIGRKIKNIFSI